MKGKNIIILWEQSGSEYEYYRGKRKLQNKMVVHVLRKRKKKSVGILFQSTVGV